MPQNVRQTVYKHQQGKNEETISIGGSVYLITVVQKTGKISCEKMTMKYLQASTRKKTRRRYP